MIEFNICTDTTTIVVLNYNTSEVVIHKNVDNRLLEEEYNGDVESYLVGEFDYDASSIYFMCGDNVRLKYQQR